MRQGRQSSKGMRLTVLLLLFTLPLASCQDEAALPVAQPSSLVIGTNPTGNDDAALFAPLYEGDPLEIEFGFQGLWMVVLAFKTQPLQGRVTVVARVRTDDGHVIGEFGLAKQELVEGDDGDAYYLNLFCVVEGTDAVGERATVEIEVEDKAGTQLSDTVMVMLTGGEVPHIRPPVPDAGSDADPVDAE